MTRILGCLSICFLLSFSACNFQDHVDPGVDKAKVIEALTAFDRYWRFEAMTKEVGGKTINLLTENTPPPFEISLYYHNLGYQFNNSSLKTLPMSGPTGDRPYRLDTLEVLFTNNRENIKWSWDDSKQTIKLTGFDEGFRPLTGYLNSSMFPIYKNLAEAVAGGKPERIQIIMQETDPVLGLITYRYSLRAAWITRGIYGSSLQRFYEILY